MSTLTTARTAAKHRRKSHTELYAEIARLERENEQLACAYTKLAAQYLIQQDELDQAGIDVSGALEDKRVAEVRADLAERQRHEEHVELTRLRARVANLDPWRLPGVGTRDVDPGDEATQPIDVRALRAVHAEPWTSPVIHLSQAPFATIPTPTDVDPRNLATQFTAGPHRVTATGMPFAKTSA